MKKIAVISTLIFFLGCASTKQQATKIADGCIRKPAVGFVPMKLPDGQIEVFQSIEGDPAEKAGIRKGDIIKAIDGHYVDKRIDLVEIIDKKEPGDHILITVQRDGSKTDFNVKLGFVDEPQDFHCVRNIFWDEKNIRLAFITGEIINVILYEPYQLEQWRKGIKSQILVDLENSYLNVFKFEKNFSIVDRQRVEEILKELEFGLSGVVSEELRSKLGEILGANHLLVIEYSRFLDKSSTQTRVIFEDVRTHRLIEVETGKVLASVIVKSKL